VINIKTRLLTRANQTFMMKSEALIFLIHSMTKPEKKAFRMAAQPSNQRPIISALSAGFTGP